jgi:hypothetical protein
MHAQWGMLIVFVRGAANLVSKNRLNGSSDPYCKVDIIDCISGSVFRFAGFVLTSLVSSSLLVNNSHKTDYRGETQPHQRTLTPVIILCFSLPISLQTSIKPRCYLFFLAIQCNVFLLWRRCIQSTLANYVEERQCIQRSSVWQRNDTMVVVGTIDANQRSTIEIDTCIAVGRVTGEK